MTGLPTRWAPAGVGAAVLRVTCVLCDPIGERLNADAVNLASRRRR
jgi:hypothetical protein